VTSPSKRKGDAAELAAAKALAELTGLPVRRKLGAGRADDTGDLYGIPDTVVQVKNYADSGRAIRECLRDSPVQQANDGATFAASMVWLRGGPWVVVMTIDQFATYVRESLAGPGGAA